MYNVQFWPHNIGLHSISYYKIPDPLLARKFTALILSCLQKKIPPQSTPFNFSTLLTMTHKSTARVLKKIQKSKEEFRPYLNFLQQKYNPDAGVLARPNNASNTWFQDFHRFHTVFGTTDTWDKHELRVYMLVPKALNVRSGARVVVHCLFHGGGLVSNVFFFPAEKNKKKSIVLGLRSRILVIYVLCIEENGIGN